ncbi:stage III sporulation protein AA [Halobacillus seohaensis]|uniref:Stage III sporulation protein AA n=1 Tax=Halobacillus seohaensis TaxID=447421 RepID=A0ABW2EEF5_9BACI
MEEIIRLFPVPYHPTLKQKINWDIIQEIRLRVNKRLEILDTRGVTYISNTKLSQLDLSFVLNQVSQFSVYKFKEEMKEGFITIEGGHRVGLAGKANVHQNVIETLKNITFMNIRIARSTIESGKRALSYLYRKDEWLNTLIIGPPHSGKTTILRNFAKWIGSGTTFTSASKVAVVDERSEIAACHEGIPQLDVGERTDVMDACPKAVGMMMMIRSMSPEVMVVDEIGDLDDALAVKEAVHTGVKVICSVHGTNRETISKRNAVQELIESEAFDRFIILERLSVRANAVIEILDGQGNELVRLNGEGDHGVVRSPNSTTRYHMDRV